MRLLPSDPDIETIVSRIGSSDLNLQPDFQRGEVWTRIKKQKLVDSILRDWHVPPIHVIEHAETRKQEVLDGQQRLVAIRDFWHNSLPVNGHLDPLEKHLSELDGMLFCQLPERIRRQFSQFTIRIFRIVDFAPGEPAELFYRLNQPTNLTAAEQRNAFFGAVREQVKGLVEQFKTHGIDKSFLGFSNARMAYDDVVSRVALTLERGTLSHKIASNDLVDLYRRKKPLSAETMEQLTWAIETLGRASQGASLYPSFNKATLYSWLLLLIRALRLPGPSSQLTDPHLLQAFLTDFDLFSRNGVDLVEDTALIPDLPYNRLFAIYFDRSASRVADVSSILLRDLVLWIAFALFSALRYERKFGDCLPAPLLHIVPSLLNEDAENIAKALLDIEWGVLQ